MNLVTDDFLSSNGKHPPAETNQSHGEKNIHDFNDLFENQIFVDEREFVNYNQMFNNLPITDLVHSADNYPQCHALNNQNNPNDNELIQGDAQENPTGVNQN